MKKYIGLILCFLIVVFVVSMPKKTIAYVRDNTIVQTDSGEIKYEILDAIEVVKNDNSDEWIIYEGIKKIGLIKESDVVFAGTDEYAKAEKIKAERDRKAEELAKIEAEKARIRKAQEQKLAEQAKKRELAELERIVKSAFYNVSLENYVEEYGGIYQFFVDPIVWNSLAYSEQKNIFYGCVRYVELKCNVSERHAQCGTRIINSYDGKTLASVSKFL